MPKEECSRSLTGLFSTIDTFIALLSVLIPTVKDDVCSVASDAYHRGFLLEGNPLYDYEALFS